MAKSIGGRAHSGASVAWNAADRSPGNSLHRLDGDRQSFLVNDIHLLADPQLTDEGQHIRVFRNARARPIIRRDEADGPARRIDRRDRNAATTNPGNLPAWPLRRIIAIHRHTRKGLIATGERADHLRRERLVVSHGHAVTGMDFIEPLYMTADDHGQE